MITYKITFTKKADKDEDAIYKYILNKFGETYGDKFRQKLIVILKTLSKQPYLGRTAKNDATLRVYIFSKQNKMVYKVTETEIIIVRILNTKTNFASKF